MTDGAPALSRAEAEAVVAAKTAPRVTEEAIEAKIAAVEYVQVGQVMTLCLIHMQNGWVQTGASAPTSPANFDAEVGQRIAYDEAFTPLRKLEGYLLREELHRAAERQKRRDERGAAAPE